MNLLLTYGSSGEALARSVASLTGLEIAETERRQFPDGEQHIKVLHDVEGEDVAVFQSLGLKPDMLLMEYCLLVDALKGSGCRSVTAVIPYMAYARQDRRFSKGEPLSAKLVAKLIESPGADRLVTVDMHLHRFRNISDVFDIPAVNLSAMPLLTEYYLSTYGCGDVLVVGPDSESEQWAKSVANKLSANYVVLDKERLGDRDVTVTGELKAKGLRVVLVDDMISTGKTLIEVIGNLKHHQPARIDALVSHALLVEEAFGKLKASGLSDLISTDTVDNPTTRVSVAPLIAQVLKQ